MSNLSISHSKVQTAQCLRRYYFNYELRRSPLEEPKELIQGKVFHAFIETGDYGTIVDATALGPDLRAVLIALAGNYRPVVATETKLEVKLTIDNFVPGANLVGVIDGEHIDEQAQFYIRETKTTRATISVGSDYWTKTHWVNPQHDLYHYLEREHGRVPAYTLWDAIRIPALKRNRATPIAEREFYKRATGSAAVGDPKPGTYLNDESFEQFRGRADETIRTNPGEFYHRETVIANDQSIADTVEGVKYTTQALLSAHESNSFPCNKSLCFSYGRPCDYLPVCSGKASIDDPTLYKIRHKREEIA